MKPVLKLTAVALLMAAMPLTANAQFARNNDAPIDATADDRFETHCCRSFDGGHAPYG